MTSLTGGCFHREMPRGTSRERHRPSLDAGEARGHGAAEPSKKGATWRRRPPFDTEAVSRLIGSIYDAALDPALWRSVLPALADALGAERGVLGFVTPARGSTAVTECHEIDGDLLQRWRDEFGGFDPWYERIGVLPAGTVVSGQQLVPWSDLRRMEVHQALFHPGGIDDLLCAVVASYRGGHDYVTVHRGRRRGSFSRDDTSRFRALAPHLVRAAEIQTLLGPLWQAQKAHELLFDMLPHGVALLDDRGHLIFANTEAQRILAASDGLSVVNGSLRASSPDAQRTLLRGVGEASANTAQGTSFAVLRPSRLRAYQVLISPVCGEVGARIFGFMPMTCRAIAVIVDPEAMPEVAAERLERVFRLTPALARLAAALAAGQTVSEYADAVGITVGTARWQLKELFARTGTSRQAELVRLLLTSVAQFKVAADT